MFQKKTNAKDVAKQAKRNAKKEVRSNQRGLDREMRELDRQEQQLIKELKQRAKKVSGNDPSLKTLAKQLVQIRQSRDKLMGTKYQLGAMGMHATTMASQVAAASAIAGVTGALQVANSQMDTAETMKIMAEFTKQNERMNVQEEMMDDVLTEAFDQEGLDGEAEQVTNQVLAELGVEMDQKFVGLNAPASKPQQQANLSPEEEEALQDVLPDLQSRLNAL